MRQKKCRSCRQPFVPKDPMQPVCSPACDAAYRREHLNTRSGLRQRKSLLRQRAPLARQRVPMARRPAARPATAGGAPTISQLMRQATAAFNAYIRARDAHLPCVSCGSWHALEWHAGHYMSVGARSELRFDEANVHRQCSDCNTARAGNHKPYRVTLLTRIGAAEVQRLEGITRPRKWTADELREITAAYTERLALLRQLTGGGAGSVVSPTKSIARYDV